MGVLDPLLARQRAAATQLTELLADEILGEAQRIVPLREGTLGASASRDTTQLPNGIDVVMRFSTVYAARQHEELTWTHREGRRAKYLEAPFKQRITGYAPAMARALAAVTR